MKPYFFSFSNFLKSPDPAWADMNGFKNIEPGFVDVDGTNTKIGTFDPEHANQYELGLKTNLYKVSL